MSSESNDIETIIEHGGVEGRHVTLSDSFELGRYLSYLRLAAGHGYSVGDGESEYILEALERISNLLQAKDFESSVAGKSKNLKNELESEYEPDEELSDEDAEDLDRKVRTWITLLEEDLREEQRVPAAETGVMEVDKLLNSPDDLFTQPVWNWLHEESQSDISEACRSIVVGSPTACVMLSLRAVEHCLRVWYEEETDDSIEAGWGRVLGKMVDEFLDDDSTNLELQQQLSEVPPVLSNLYYLKEKRNQVNHPERSPTNNEARQTLMLAVGTITDIYNEVVDEVLIVQNNIEIELPEEGMEDQDKFLSIITALDEGDGAAKSDVYEAGESLGYNKYEVQEVLHAILMGGHAYEPASGRLKAI